MRKAIKSPFSLHSCFFFASEKSTCIQIPEVNSSSPPSNNYLIISIIMKTHGRVTFMIPAFNEINPVNNPSQLKKFRKPCSFFFFTRGPGRTGTQKKNYIYNLYGIKWAGLRIERKFADFTECAPINFGPHAPREIIIHKAM